MGTAELLVALKDARISLSVDGDAIVLKGSKGRITDAIKSSVLQNKAELIAMLTAEREADAGGAREAIVPDKAIPPDCTAITPAMLPLIELTEEEIGRVVSHVPGGAANVEEIHALTPLQEGILFHHRLAREGDPYLLGSQIVFPNRPLLDRFLEAVRQVVARHEILRSAFVWEGVSEPAQVVWRRAPLPVTERTFDPAHGPIDAQLAAACDPRRHRIDLGTAPLLRFDVARDPAPDADHAGDRWIAQVRWHHLIGDHSTLDLLRGEVEAILDGRSESLPPPRSPRALVAHMRAGRSQAEHERFFRRMLGDVSEPSLPYGSSDIHQDGGSIEETRRPLPADLHARLRVQARRLGVSVASLCHLAWGQVIARASGSGRALFGTVLVGRSQASGAGGAAGLFINTLPLRLDLEDLGAEAAARETHARLGELLEHEHASLPLALRCSGVPAPGPLFTALLNYRHNAPRASGAGASAQDGPLAGVRFLRGEERTNYPLALSVDDYGDALALTVQVVPTMSSELICGHVQQALESLAAALETDAPTPVRRLNILPPAERARLLDTWNETSVPERLDRCAHRLFEEQAARAPAATAAVCDGQSLTYGELNARANRLAHHLIALGVRPDDRVAICVERGLEITVGWLAILKAGAAYVPIDPAYPDERVGFIVSDSAPVALLTQERLRRRFEGVAAPLLLLDAGGEGSSWSARPHSNPEPDHIGLRPEHVAYVIYTSGSTGAPKGVMVEHRGLVNLALAQRESLAVQPDDRVLQVSSFSFDASVFEMAMALFRGATLVLPPPGDIVAGETLLGMLERHRITHATLTPGVLATMPRQAAQELDQLRLLVVAGEALPGALAGHWARGRRVINAYGPTEATIWTTAHDCAAGVSAPPPIGRPIANTRVYVLDEQGDPAPIGMAGELYIGGAGVARGYLNRPELTRERFLADPFTGTPGARMYRSGDLVRYHPDGALQFLGRNDHQVKVRGIRIELGEIEARLAAHARVREAAVIARGGEAGHQRLVAYVVLAASDADPDDAAWTSDLRAHLAASLPEYMVPSAFVRLDALPMTPHGKVDRRALPAPDDDARPRRAHEAPRGAREEALAGVWRELLALERVGRHDHFFELGGHSLLAVRLIERLRQRKLQLDIRDLFTHPVLADLAACLDEASEPSVPANAIATDGGRVTPAMLPLIDLTQEEIDRVIAAAPGGVANLQDIYGLTALQDGILFHHLLSREGDPYLMSRRMAFDSRELLDRFMAAVQRVIDRHDILRTAFLWEGVSRPVQLVLRHVPLAVTEVALDPHAGPIEQQLAAAFDPRRHRLDPRTAPLLRFVVAHDPAHDRWLLLQLLHHLIGDHSTLDLLRTEVFAIMAGQEGTLSAPRPFRDLVAQTRRGGSEQEHERFFRELLGDVDEPTLPFGLADIYQDGGVIAEARRMLPVVLSDRIRAQARRLGVGVASLCHLAFGQVVARGSGTDRVVFGTVLFGRMQAGTGADQGAGLFINTLPLRLDLGDVAAEQAVRQTHARLGDLLVHEHASLGLAQRCSGVSGQAPLFSALFNYRYNQADPASQLSAREPFAGIEVLRTDERTNYPLTLSAEDWGHTLGLTALVAPSVSAERVCGYMEQALESLVGALETAPLTPLRELEVVPPAERTLLVRTWNETPDRPVSPRGIHELFEAQARRRPSATAVELGDSSLSYGQLNAEANRLAHHLIGLGVAPDEPIAICVERSLGMIVGLLAILKAGAAYLPLDPAYPEERLAQILEDAAPRIIVTDTAGRIAIGETLAAGRIIVDVEALAAGATPPWADRPATDPDAAARGFGARHLAYIIYTSGSTGRPKGVMVEHAQVTRLFDTTEALFDFDEHDVWCLFHSFAFDFSVWELWGALRYGGRLIVVPRDVARSSRDFHQLVCDRGVTVLNQTPSAFKTFIDADADEPRPMRLRYVIFGGEALEPRTLAPWYRRHAEDEPRLVNMYGITETTVHVTYRAMREEDARHVVSPIGTRLPDLRIYLLDSARRPVPWGAVGELYVGGAGVARGYLHRPELTAERFLDDPFAGAPAARMYKTGDLARYLPDGGLQFLGRNDQQVKVRGFRIELGEIALRISSHPEVHEAIVVPREDAVGEKALVAYFVTTANAADVDATEWATILRAHAAAALPEYMVPAAFVRLDALPLTPNGKLDRQALPAPDDEAYPLTDYEPPRGEVEAIVAEIWQDLLGVGRVGRNDNFFELGGHSLLAVQLIERLRRAGLHFEIRTLIGAPVLCDLAAQLSHQNVLSVPANGIAPGTTRITPSMLSLIDLTQAEIDHIVAQVPGGAANIQDIYGLTPLQDGILFHNLLAREGDPYLMSSQITFADRDTLDRFLRAVQQVMNRHDILRTAFFSEGLSRPAQVVLRDVTLMVTELELPPGRPAVEQLAERFDPARYRVNLSEAPLLRYFVAREPGTSRWQAMQLRHHLIEDAVSVQIFRDEVRAFLRDEGQTLAPPPPFRTLVAQTRFGVPDEEHERFFREMLGEVSAPTLPFGLSDVYQNGGQFSWSFRMVPEALNDRLRAHARRLGVGVASLCHLAWGQVVARSSGSERVVFGSVLFGRMQGGDGADQAAGLFINTLPFRLDLDDTPTEAAVRRAHALLGDLLMHEHASLALAQRCSGVAAPSPLFSALLNYRHGAGGVFVEGEADAFAGLEYQLGERRTNYPLTLTIEDLGDGFRIVTQAAQPIVPERICAYVQQALESLVDTLDSAPGAPIRHLEILPPAERALLLESWNATAVPYPADRGVHELFEEQARLRPTAIAVVDGPRTATYASLNARANHLARRLIDRGARPGDFIAVHMDRSIELVVAEIAILKCGAAYVPMDPNLPAERELLLVADCQARLIVTRSDVALPPDLSASRVDADEEMAETEAGANPGVPVGGGTRAYVMYTSGSTGEPKGVIVPHRAIARLVMNTDYAPFDENQRLAFASNPSFDASTLEVWAPLLHGGRIVVVPQDVLLAAPRFGRLLVDEGVSTMFLTVGMFNQYADVIGKELSSVRHLITGGDSLRPDVIARMLRQHPPAHLLNAYGPTETTTFATTYDIPDVPEGASGIPIGRPIANTRIYLLDPARRPVPIGAVGEIYIGGPGVACGYLNRPELTAERFLADPFVSEPEARMYRTGDLARHLPDGNLQFLGRDDHQVKIRGFRVELGEIETCLAAHPLVRAATVVARDDAPGGKRLAAYIVSSAAAAPDEAASQGDDWIAAMRAHVAATLPEYMVPAAFVRLEALPLTPNGKVDRAALPAPDDDAYARGAYEAPSGEIELALAAIWRDLLGIERISRNDHFFELGGHSLLTVQLIERLRRAHLHMDVRTLFSTPVLRDLAVGVRRERDARIPPNAIRPETAAITPAMLPLIDLTQAEIDRVVASVPGGVANIQDIYALAPLQAGILFHHMLAREGDPYLMSSQIIFPDRALLERFLSAVQQVIDRHDILRTAFVWQGMSTPAQVVWRRAPLTLTEVTLDPRDGSIAAQLADLCDPHRHRLDLAQAPLLRFITARDPRDDRWGLSVRWHHLIGDHSTLDVLRAEVHAFLTGRGAALPPAEPYRQLVAEARLGMREEEHERFFREMLGDVTEPTLPFGLADVHQDEARIDESHRMLPPRLNDRLRAQARRLGVSVASLCHLAWGQVLARCAGSTRVVFGTVLFGRMQAGAGADQGAGLFINTLPLRLDLDDTPTEAAVRQAHARLGELLMHEHASLALAQRCSGVAAGAPLFSALFNYRYNRPHDEPSDTAHDPLAGVEFLPSSERTTYALTLNVEELGDALGLTAQIVTPASAERVCGYMQQALESLADALETAPDRSVRLLDVLPPDERRLLVETWNQTPAPAAAAACCIHELFEAQVRRRPQATAVVFGDRTLGYAELNAEANRLAHHLVALGVRPDDRVAICVERGLGLVIGLLGILKAGGAYVPLDTAHPAARLTQMLDDASPAVVLCDAAGRAAIGVEALEERTVVDLEAAGLDPSRAEWAARPATDLPAVDIGLEPSHLAYIIYTSGSTGAPKGVMVEHAQVTRLFEATQADYRFDEQDVWCLFHSFAFDFSVWELWGALRHGGRLIVVPRDVARSSRDFHRLVCEQGVTVLNQTPSAFKAFIDADAADPRPMRLRYVIFGGEALEPSMLAPWYRRHAEDDPRLVNMYGITETTVHVTCRPLTVADSLRAGSPVGARLADLRIYVLDDDRRPVPWGATGEIFVGGAGVARGYLHRPDLTAERFLDDPFAPEPGARMYKTGDLARYQPDGELQFLGRNDHQVKIRGFRIELGEIEMRMASHPLVHEAVVIARDEASGEKSLIAYIVPPANAVPLEPADWVATLRAHASETLPDYMVPTAFVRLEALPLTPNGKLDRQALPAPEGEAYAFSAYEPPDGAIEEAIAAIWRELLGVERVGRRDNFFELGGHSLLAVQFLARVREATGAEVPMAELFMQPTLGQLAQVVAAAVTAGAPPAPPPIVAAARDLPLPLSFAQQRLWFLAQLPSASATYHMPLALRLEGPLDHVALHRSLDTLMARHEALRTIFTIADGRPQVEILPTTTRFPLVLEDLRGRSDAAARLSASSFAEPHLPFDLSTGPLIRGRLVRMADEDHVFLLTQHHIVSDGWSVGLIARELGTLYRAFQADEPDPLPPPAIQYPDYAVWQRQWLSGPVLARQKAYWQDALAGAPPTLELPTDRPRPPQQEFAGASVPIALDRELTSALAALSRRQGTTLFMTMLTAWAVVLARLSGQEEIVIGVPTANRRPATEQMLGCFVNSLALRVDLRGAPTVSELLARVRETAVAAQDHQDLPFEQVVDLVRPPRRLDHTPVFQVMFAWQNLEVEPPDLGDIRVSPAPKDYAVARFDLELTLSEQREEIVGSLAYATSLFERATIVRHREYLVAALRAMAADPARGVAAIELLGPDERALVIDTWNATDAPYEADRCVHERFEERARANPGATALIYAAAASGGDGPAAPRSISYGALNREANQLAHHLAAIGLRPDDRVAICLERGPGMVIGLLAILKAGGAYVPLDPSYPSDRLAQILADAAPVLVLADAAGRAAIGAAALAARTVIDLQGLGAEGTPPPEWSMRPDTDPEPAQRGLTSHHLAYVIYTSGSTGAPKGVMTEHHALVNRLTWMQDAYALTAADVVLQKTPFTFDVSVWELFWPLRQGATLAIAPPGAHKDASRIAALVRDWGVTTVHFVPSMLAVFVAVEALERCVSLRRVICSGEALAPKPLRDLLDRLPDVSIHNLYGPTEAAIDVTAWPCPRPFTGDIVPIGRPIANTRIYLLNHAGQPVPAGAVGEIYIGGVGVARGYLRRPDLTAERFVRDPFSDRPGARMYRTGDLARHAPDGSLIYLGRNDQQVKIRGFRVEPGEIETRLAEHPLVREAAVLAREDAERDTRLIAYVVARDPESASAEWAAALRAHLAERLPEYMVPSAFVRLDALPVTPNGKLDRRALPAPDDEAFARRAYEAPRGATEEALAGIWQELLGLDRVGRNDHFFELGGHSLLAVQLIERLRRLEWRLDIRALFGAPVLHDLAAQLRPVEEAPEPPQAIPPDATAITPAMLPLIDLTQEEIDRVVRQVPGGAANVQDIYALAPLQDGILFHHLLAREGDPYILSSLMAFRDRALVERFLAAMQQVIDRHDILRTAFVWEGVSTPVQVVWRRAPIAVIDAAFDRQDGPIAAQLAGAFDPRRARLSLAEAPLLRFAVAHDPEQDRWLVLARWHHLIGDHSTLDLLRREVQAFLAGRGEALAGAVPFRQLVAQARMGIAEQEHERFFRSMLGDITEPTLPFGLADVYQDGGDIVEARRLLPSALNDRVRAQARRLGVSVASICHLAWGQVVARGSGTGRVVFGTVLFGRAQPHGADAAGLFINTLPLRLDLDDTPLETALRQTHARLGDLLRHEHASLALAQRCSGVASSGPLFSALLNYRHQAAAAETAVAADPERPPLGAEFLGSTARNNYPLTLSVEDYGDALGLTSLVARTLASDRVCGYMQRALESMVSALETTPRMPVREIEVQPEEERRLLIETWNATDVPFASDRCLHQLFEAQARATPEARAVEYEGRALAYGELNARANQLAHHLIGLGVGPDEPVAICVERGLPMIVGLLAILKAGGAYVPLDPTYPSERLAQMLADAGSRIVLSDTAGRAALDMASFADRQGIDLDRAHVDPAGATGAPATPWAARPVTDPDAAARGLTPRHLAYVIYTSGSTGEPKGVMVEHRSVVNFHEALLGTIYPPASVPRRIGWNASFAFDMSIKGLSRLFAGDCLVIVPQAVRASGAAMAEWLASARIDAFDTTPSQLKALVAAGLLDDATPRTVLLGGEAVEPALWSQLRRCAALTVHNMYGPTECTVDATIGRLDADDDRPHIGRAIVNTRVYVLDEARRPAPLGAVGEIYVGGVGVARGYWRRPEATEERFLSDPFSAEPGARMYKTGDLARQRPDGSLEYIGRNDQQVKIRGFRIELGEIEARLAAHPLVREAVVLARAEVPGDVRLTAYVLPRAGAPAPDDWAAALRADLANLLPEYMVPAAFVRVEAWPLTPNGKLNRAALPAAGDEAYAHRAYAAPRGAVEETLAALWRELLGVDGVGRRDHFFELGGHSLLAVQLMVRIRQTFDTDVTLRTLMTSPTLADLAAAIEAGLAAPGGHTLVPVRTEGTEPPLFLIHPGGGGVDYARRLAPYIDAAIPVYGLQASGLTPGQRPPESVDEMAGAYLRWIRQARPDGPYRLAGWSAGGVIAYEIARRLAADGAAVDFVGLLDTGRNRGHATNGSSGSNGSNAADGSHEANGIGAPPDRDDKSELLAFLSRQLDPGVLADLTRVAETVDFDSLVQRVYALDLVPRAIAALPPLDPAAIRCALSTRQAIRRAVDRFEPPRFAAPVWFFEARDNPVATSHGWRELVGDRLQIVSVPGTHLTMMEGPEHLRSLGLALSDAIQQSADRPAAAIPSDRDLESSGGATC